MKLIRFFYIALFPLLIVPISYSAKGNDPLRIGIVGLSHSHVHWLLNRPDFGDLVIVGITEPNIDLAERYSKQYGFPMDIVFCSLSKMIDSVNPQAVAGFGPIRQHLEIVEQCAPKGIHVMIEKPLAVSLQHAEKMKELANRYSIQLLTNYETTWYPTNHKLFDMVQNEDIGDLRKIIVSDGHKGPKEIGVNKEFLNWLTNPVENGGGALTDFGCYGANLITWLKKGEKPISVTAVVQNFKPDIYQQVDDEATIILKYNDMQGIIQASWNWPFSRKDMEVYGTRGYIISQNRNDIRYKLGENKSEINENLKELKNPFNDPFAYFSAVIKKEILSTPYDLGSIENNLIVMKILDAAKKSADTGKTVEIK